MRQTMRQLTSLDAQFLAMEGPRTYGHVGGLAIYDPSTAPGGKVGIEDICRVVAERLPLLEPFRWRLAEVPLGIDHPYWIEDPHFDLDFHIRESAVPPPGDDGRLAETVARIFARPLDRTRPLWELYLIHGLPQGRVAILTKVHHAAVDGVSGAEILGALLDLAPEGREVPPDERVPEREPSELEMLGRGLLGLPRQPLRMVKSLPRAARGLPRFPGAAMVPGYPALRRALGGDDRSELLETVTTRAPRLSFNRKIGAARRYSFGSLSLQKVKDLKNELGITVNDVVVGLCATGLRDWLTDRDELPRGPLVALIPVSVRTRDEQGTFGNKVSGMILPIPTHITDPRERLMKAHEVLRVAKERHGALPASLMTDVSNFIPPALFTRASRAGTEIAGRIRTPLNVAISNVPGPAVPLYCAGAELQANYPVSVIMDGVGLNITVMSYRDHLDFGIIGDRDTIADTWDLMGNLARGLEEMHELVCSKPKAPAQR